MNRNFCNHEVYQADKDYMQDNLSPLTKAELSLIFRLFRRRACTLPFLPHRNEQPRSWENRLSLSVHIYERSDKQEHRNFSCRQL